MASDWEGEDWQDAYAPKSGTSRDGMPLSINRAPAEDLRPWVARLVAAKIEAVPGSLIRCGICTDLAYERVILSGEWAATSVDGTSYYRDEALLFGPSSCYMPVGCSGPVMSIGVGFRPGAMQLLTGRAHEGLLNHIERSDPLGLIERNLAAEFPLSAEPEEWLARVEEILRRRIAAIAPPPPDSISTAFELAGFADPNLSLSEFSEMQGISLRKLERVVKRDFGLTPKQVLRRARARSTSPRKYAVWRMMQKPMSWSCAISTSRI